MPTPGSKPICRRDQLPDDLMHGEDYWSHSGQTLLAERRVAAARPHAGRRPANTRTGSRRSATDSIGSTAAWSNYVVELDCRTPARRHLSAHRRRRARAVASRDQCQAMAGDVQLRRRRPLPRSSQPRGRVARCWASIGARAAWRCLAGSAGCCSAIGRRLLRPAGRATTLAAAAAAGSKSRSIAVSSTHGPAGSGPRPRPNATRVRRRRRDPLRRR